MTVIRSVFVGRTGLRPGWGVALFAVVLAILIAARGVFLGWARPAFGIDPDEQWVVPSFFLLFLKGSLVILTLGATFVMAGIEHRSPWSYGLAGTRSMRNFLVGSLGGMAFCSVLVGLMVLGGGLVLDGWALHGLAIFEYGLFWALCLLLVAFFEEILFRGYLQHTLARGMGFWPAALCSSSAFGLIHLLNSGENLPGILLVISGGVFFSLCLKLTGSLWWGIGFHSALGWAESFFYGTSNSGTAVMVGHLLDSHPTGDALLSGGSAGPEGSIICAGLVAVFILCGAAATRLKR